MPVYLNPRDIEDALTRLKAIETAARQCSPPHTYPCQEILAQTSAIKMLITGESKLLYKKPKPPADDEKV